VRASVHASYLACQEDFTVSVTAFYDKLQGAESQVAQALVRESSARLAPLIKELRAQLPPLLPGYYVSFRWACVKRFERRSIVGCRHLNLWRTAHAYQASTRTARPAGGGTAAI